MGEKWPFSTIPLVESLTLPSDWQHVLQACEKKVAEGVCVSCFDVPRARAILAERAMREASSAAAAAEMDVAVADVLPGEWVDDVEALEEARAASISLALPRSNRGYSMLKKMGWRPGLGLGRCHQGMSVLYMLYYIGFL